MANSDDHERILLLDFAASPFGMRAHLALAAQGVQYETAEEDRSRKSPLLLRVNPIHQSIPVMIHNGNLISESLIIMDYIDEVWKGGCPLTLAKEPKPGSGMTSSTEQYIHPPSYNVWGAKGEEQEVATKEFLEKIKMLEGELHSKPYFGGESLGFLGIAFLPFYGWFHTYENSGKFSMEAECPKLVAWGQRSMQHEFVNTTHLHPHRVYDIVVEFKKSLGT